MKVKLAALWLLMHCAAQLYAQLPLPRPMQEAYPTRSLQFSTGMIVKNWDLDTYPRRLPSALLHYNHDFASPGIYDWHKALGLSQSGMSIIGGWLGNTPQLGYMVGVVPYLRAYFGQWRHWHVHFTAGVGLAAFNRPYHALHNPYNIIVGSHITNLSYATLRISKPLTQNWTLLAGTTTYHASNGHFKVPNAGLNLPGADIGIAWRPRNMSDQLEIQRAALPPYRFNLRLGMGMHEFAGTIGPTGTPKYRIWLASPYASWQWGPVSNIHFGFSLKRYEAYAVKIKEKNLFADKKLYTQASAIEMLAAHELVMGQVSLVLQGSLSLHDPFYRYYRDQTRRDQAFRRFIETWFKSRIAMHWYPPLGNNYGRLISLGIGVNAHFGEADFVELSAAMHLPW